MKSKLMTSILLVPLAITSMVLSAAEDLIIITAMDNTEQIKLEDVSRIFLGKATRFPSGEIVVPLNLHPSDPIYAEFARVVLKKTESQLRAYWAKQVFTGKRRPPRVISSTKELQQMIASDKQYLSYVGKSKVSRDVRRVIEVSR
ncbi:MAG: hypothetical protein ACI9KN_002374 [Gammaproteobacteria bacterium]|jgi:hypothetical protein